MNERQPSLEAIHGITISELDIRRPAIYEECFALDFAVQKRVESVGHPGWYLPLNHRELYEFLDRPGHVVGARNVKNELVGYTKFEDRDLTGLEQYHLPGDYHQRILEVTTIAVAIPNRGIGKQLMQTGEKIAREKSCTNMGLKVSARNTPAQRFYETCGLVLWSHMAMATLANPHRLTQWGEDSLRYPYYKYIGEDQETRNLYSHTRLNRKMMHTCVTSPEFRKPVQGVIGSMEKWKTAVSNCAANYIHSLNANKLPGEQAFYTPHQLPTEKKIQLLERFIKHDLEACTVIGNSGFDSRKRYMYFSDILGIEEQAEHSLLHKAYEKIQAVISYPDIHTIRPTFEPYSLLDPYYF